MHIVTADLLDELCKGPLTDTPEPSRILGVRPFLAGRPHVLVPLKVNLVRDLPEVSALAPLEGLPFFVKELGTNPVGLVMGTFEIFITVGLSHARRHDLLEIV